MLKVFAILVLYGRYILLAAVLYMILSSCGIPREAIQSELEIVKLYKIEVKFRSPDYVAWTYWADEHHHTEYVSEIKIEDTANYKVGMRAFAMVKR